MRPRNTRGDRRKSMSVTFYQEDYDLHRQIKLEAVNQEKSVCELLREAARSYFMQGGKRA